MLTIPQTLGTLGAKSKSATRTAKDGEEYSQFVCEVEHDIDETQTNSLCGSPRAFDAFKAVLREVKQVAYIDFDETLEGATVLARLAAVSAQNGPEFKFTACRLDNFRFANQDSDDLLKISYRITAKPALDSKFGELIARLGHTAMIEVRADLPSDQAEMPLNSAGANERGTSSIGTPEQERERAHQRERRIQAEREQLEEEA